MLKDHFTDKEEFEYTIDSKANLENLLNLKYSLDIQINELAKVKIDYEETRKQLKTVTLELEVYKVRLENKADHEKMLFLQASLNEYTPLCDFNNLMDSIPGYAKNERVKVIIEKIDQLEAYVQDMAKQETIMNKLDEMRSKLAQRLNLSLTKDEFVRNSKKINDKILTLEKELWDKQGQIDKLETKLADDKKKAQLKLDKTEFHQESKKLWNNFDRYWEFQNLANFEGRMTPIIKECHMKVEKCVGACDHNKSIIQRFDEVLSQKASKVVVSQINTDLQGYQTIEDFHKFIQTNDHDFFEVNDKWRELNLNMELIETNLSQELAEAIYKVEIEVRK